MLNRLQQNKELILFSFIGGYLIKPIWKTIRRKWQEAKERQQSKNKIYVGIELGGTNYNIAFGKAIYNDKFEIDSFDIIIRDQGRVTDKPNQTLGQIQNKIIRHADGKPIHYVGISCFGPLDLNKKSQSYGNITSTPKPGWKNTPVLRYFLNSLPCKNIEIQTDVNSAAFAEFKIGKHEVNQSLAYVTVGTGVGVGIISNNKTIHGLTHPQGGHIIVKLHQNEYQNFNGVCPFHKNCLEGMVANHSIAKRTGVQFTKLHDIQDGEKVWQIIAYYLAQLCVNLTLTVSPERIIIGGGVMNRKILFPLIRQNFIRLLAKYVEHPLYTKEKVDQYIISPKLGSDVGVMGGFLLRFM